MANFTEPQLHFNMDDPTIINFFKCVCGGRIRFVERIPERGVILMVCTAQDCNTEYGYPIDHPYFKDCVWNPIATIATIEAPKEITLAPGFTPANQPIKSPPRIYCCIDCKEPIPKERALQTLDIFGRALCEVCQIREE